MKQSKYHNNKADELEKKRRENPALKDSVFAKMLGKSQPDRGYFKGLYQFKAEEELEDYKFPSTQKEPQKVNPGMLNTLKLPPIDSQEQSKEPKESQEMQEDEELEDEEELEEREHPGLEQDVEEGKEGILTYETLEQILDRTNSKNKSMGKNWFIEKNTALYDELMSIKTGDQAVAFFAKYGNSTPVKFIHCNRTYQNEFRPYDLIVAREKDLRAEHFTISAQGVVHTCPEDNPDAPYHPNLKKKEPLKPTEYFTLAEWMRESSLYNVLRSFKYFKNYLIEKMMRQWKGNVVFDKFSSTRKILAQNLLYMKPAFVYKYIEINRNMIDMQQKVLYLHSKNASAVNIGNIDNFVLAQKEHMGNIKSSFNECIIQSQKESKGVRELCIDVVNGIKESDKIKENDDSAKIGQKSKPKSMVKQKEENQLIERCKALAAANIKSLPRFIKLVNLMEVEALTKVILESMSLIINDMQPNKERSTGINNIAKFDPESKMVFEQNEEDFRTKIEEIVDKIKEIGISVPSILTQSDFAEILSNHPYDGNMLAEILSTSEEYKESQDAIKKMLSDHFAECRKYVTDNFEKFDVVNKFSSTFNIDEFKKKTQPLVTFRDFFTAKEKSPYEEYRSKELPIKPFEECLDKLKKWKKELKALKEYKVVGLIYIDGKKQKLALEDITNKSFLAVRDYLFECTERVTKDMKDKYNEIKEKLDEKSRKVDVKNFCEFVETQKKSDREFKILDQQQKLANDLLIVLKKFKPKGDKEKEYKNKFGNIQKVIGEELGAIQKDVKQFIADAKKFIDDNKTDVTTALTKNIDSLRESVGKGINTLENDEKSLTLKDEDNYPQAIISHLEATYLKKLNNAKETAALLSKQQATLEKGETVIKEITDYENKYNSKILLWNNVKSWKENSHSWYNDAFLNQDVDKIVKEVNVYLKNVLQIKINLCKGDKKDPVVDDLNKKVKGFYEIHIPVISALGNKALKQKHWVQIFNLLQHPSLNLAAIKTMTYSQLVGAGVEKFKDKIEDIAAYANGEKSLEQMRDDIQNIWRQMQFIVMPYRDRKDKYILGTMEDINAELEDDQMKIQTMLGSKYVTEIRTSVEEWEKKLAAISLIIDEWLSCQKQWMYLENIFSAEDIIKQLPDESKMFQEVDKFWKEHMIKTNKIKTITEVCAFVDLLSKFQKANATLAVIQRQLESYLKSKRKAFPRFYFLSNDEVIEILSDTRDPQKVQPHLRKCFDAVASLQFTSEKNSIDIIGMISAEDEKVQFSEHVLAQGNVEFWLTNVESMMRKALFDITKKCLLEYPQDGLERKNWIYSYPAQAVLTIDQIMWTKNCTDAILAIEKKNDPKALEKFLDFSGRQITKMVDLVRGELTKLQRTLIGALIVLDVHGRDVVNSMVKVNVSSTNDFEWTKQLRYYWDMEIDNCLVRQTNTKLFYSYEYIGNQARLVITPLTDKCYMTLTGALHLNFGGNPQGPAGTGKTETTKDLAKALAIQCVVFNCSDGLDYKIMENFFSGLAQSGAWSCFDEFNRIDIEVLSVIAQQILTIQFAVRKHETVVDFAGDTIPINSRFGVFITMNPGYAGRTELPDNLKALFRPISMMIPDYALIAENILFSEGFEKANALARKMVQLYKLSSEQLSKQDHYDFGMRAVKSVLVMAGALRRQYPNLTEDVVLIRAMRDSNIPKFLSQDLPLFMGIIQDLFPGVNIPNADYGELDKQIKAELDKQCLQKPDDFIRKIIQLQETLNVRHGIMMVGETGTGKSTCIHILAKALSELKKAYASNPIYQIVHIDTLNPKAVTMNNLYGYMNRVTNEWFDGLVPHLVKDAIEKGGVDKRWIVFDGPVDALWIENMNSVLDDSKILCLANLQRIKLPNTLTMMFETQDLRVASPATVSRCGMVYLEPVNLGYEPIIDTWIQRLENKDSKKSDQKGDQDDEENGEEKEKRDDSPKRSSSDGEKADLLRKLKDLAKNLKKFMKELLQLVREECKEKVPSVDVNLVQSCINLINCMIDPEEVDIKKMEKNFFNQVLVFALIWSVGANLDDITRSRFSQVFKLKITSMYSDFPDSGDIYDYYLNPTTQQFCPWNDIVKPFTYNPNLPYFQILVPTTDTTKYQYLLKLLTMHNCNLLLTGETGVGKSVVVNSYLNEPDEKKTFAFVNFSAKTTSQNLQDLIESKLETKKKTLLGPPSGKRMIFLIDDVNMPQLDRYGSQPPCELLRQLIDQHGFYNLIKHYFVEIKDSCFISCCAPPGGGRNSVSPRLFRQFNMIWSPDLSSKSMELIFTSILRGFILVIQKSGSNLDNEALNIVKASIEIYSKISQELLPTPTKSHYTFNLRDLSKVIQGILNVSHDSLTDKFSLVKLWMHESFRVFRDRLINQKDSDWFTTNMIELTKKNLEIDIDFAQSNIYFTYMSSDEREYKECKDLESIVPKLANHVEGYNLQYPNNKMDLVFFKDAIDHLSRITRILHQMRGNALLVGVGGSGRQGLGKLGAFISELIIFNIEIDKNYKEKNFNENLKDLLKKVGTSTDGKGYMFILADTQILYESFLEAVNSILNTGEVPNLMGRDDIDFIHQEINSSTKDSNYTKEQAMQTFVNRCRDNLHIVLTFSPVGDQFRNRCRQFPSIINCCTIDWYQPWPADALFSVAKKFFVENTSLGIDDYRDQLSDMCVEIHQSVTEVSDQFYQELRRRNYTTPTSYLELILQYIQILKTKRAILPQSIKRYTSGLTRLNATNKMVDSMKEKLIDLRPKIDKKEKETKELVINLEEQQKLAAEKEKSCEKDTIESEKLFDEVRQIKESCEEELAKVMPIYNTALKALDTLNKKDIQEMKTYAKPAVEIVTVLSAVALLKGLKENWNEIKLMMNDPKEFIESLKTFDKDHIPEKKLTQLYNNYVKKPEFKPENIALKSQSCESICRWVIAIENYARVIKVIEPKKKSLAKAEDELAKAKATLAEKQSELKEVRDKITNLQASYQETARMLDELKSQKELIEVQLTRAEKLIKGLEDESKRWKAAAAELKDELTNVVGNVMIAAGIISYLGPFTAKYRETMVKRWCEYCVNKKIPVSADFQFIKLMVEEVVIREWNMSGLPSDTLSIENGIMVSNARRWPLMIDPQGQANKWIRNMQKDNNIQIVKLSHNKFGQILTTSIRMGNPLLLENIEETLDPFIEPVLKKNIIKKQGQPILKLGSEDIPYSTEFKFYMTTKLSNPHYMPEICIKVTIINFTVTMDGLEQQLLGSVVRYEKPELESERDRLIVELSEFSKKLKEIEDKILKLIAEASDDILNDEELINTLDQSKVTSTQIQAQKKEAEKTAENINTARRQYVPVSVRGSVLYFVIADLSLIDPMYQYSLDFFNKLFEIRLMKSKKSEDINERIDILIKDITESFYSNICRGLFEKDKLLFSFLISVSILKRNNDIKFEEWNFFLRGSVTDYSKYVFDEDWLPMDKYQKMLGLEEAGYSFRDIGKTFKDKKDAAIWKNFLSCDEPYSAALPDKYQTKLTNFQKLMIVKILREEKLIFGIKKYVRDELGQKFTESPLFNLREVFEDSRPSTPIIFILSPGADPIPYFIKLASEKEMDGRKQMLSLGQGQGDRAAQLITTGRENGEWICLQNCHLASSWMSELEKIQEKLDEDKVHPDYRLWLTSMPSTKFPVPVLQSGVKITNEPPKGLKANLKRTFNEIESKFYESCTKPKQFKRLLFALGYFHAVILERRKFGAIGWNIPYEWMDSDFKTSQEQLKMYLEEQVEIPYQALNYLIAEINYGGRITDDKDNRLIKALLQKYFNSKSMNDKYQLSPQKEYFIPSNDKLDEVKLYIENLPQDDSPEVFGLHPNANITFQQKTIREILETILLVQPRVGGGKTRQTPEEIVTNMALEIESRLPQIMDKKKAHSETFALTKAKKPNSLGIFIGQEIDRFNKLLAIMKKSLPDLQKAIKGEVVMSMELEKMFNSFIDRKVPALWGDVSYLSLKTLATWVDDFIKRVEFIANWLYKGPPQSFWVPAFFFPQGFMTAALQTYARKTMTPIDTLKFKATLRAFKKDKIDILPEDGVNVHGLFLQGAQWDGKHLVDSEHLVLFQELPVIWLEPVNIGLEFSEHDYQCPLYKTSFRAGELSTTGHSTNFILFINLVSEMIQDYWINRGTALLCMPD